MKDLYWSNNKETEPVEKAPSDQPETYRPSFIETAENRIYFYSSVNMERILQLNKAVRNMGVDLHRQAIIQDRKPANIYLHIQSYGGSFFSAMAGMDEILKSVVPVHTIVDGCCASGATFLSICGKRRAINKHAHMLIHQLSFCMWGKYEEFRDEMENLDKLMGMIKKVYQEYTTIPIKKLEEILKHDLWFTAEECREYGLVDEIIT